MKVVAGFSLVALASALILPPEQVFSELAIEDRQKDSTWYEDVVSAQEHAWSEIKVQSDNVIEASEEAWDEISKDVQDTFDGAREAAKEAQKAAKEAFDAANDRVQDTALDFQSWLETDCLDYEESDEHHGPPHHGPPHHGPPHHGRPRHPHHPPHHGKPNQTVWQLLNNNKYTTKLAKAIGEFDDLVEALNSTEGNFTVFAPTDKAFDKIPDDVPEPSREKVKEFLSYHVVPGFYPARRVFSTHTLPTLLQSDLLSTETKPQRLAIKLGLRGLAANFYSRIIPVNAIGTNGVVHGLESILLPPPQGVRIIDLFPGEFSTLELGLGKTGLLEKLNTTDHNGGTLFAPDNFAFKKLGPRINAFLFSEYGRKYLTALLEYHVVPGHTLYSDAYYKPGSDEDAENVPKGFFHVDLPTMLEDRALAVDIARYGRIISIKINAFARVAVSNVIAKDGVVHVVRDILIPPKKLGGTDEYQYWDGESEMEVEDLMERLAPFVAKSDL